MTGLEMLMAGKKIAVNEYPHSYWKIENGVLYYHNSIIGLKKKSQITADMLSREDYHEYDESIKLTDADKNKAYQEKDNANFVYGYCAGLERWIGYNIEFGNYFTPACPGNIRVLPKS